MHTRHYNSGEKERMANDLNSTVVENQLKQTEQVIRHHTQKQRWEQYTC